MRTVLLAMLLLLSACDAAPQVVAVVSSPEPITLSLSAGNFATMTDLGYGAFLFISTDRRSDNKGDPAPVRLGVVMPYGGDLFALYPDSQTGGVEFRDLPLGIDCGRFDGTLRWWSHSSPWHFSADVTCIADPAIHVVADIAGDL